jgi:hypothetical protein
MWHARDKRATEYLVGESSIKPGAMGWIMPRNTRRMIAAEFLCEQRDMLTPAKLTHAQLPQWLAKNNYIAGAPDMAMPGPY